MIVDEHGQRSTEMNLSYQELGDKHQFLHFKSLSRSHTLQGLTVIDLSHNALTHLEGLFFPSVRKLSLAHNRISYFRDLPFMPELRDLDLRRNNILTAEDCAKYEVLERLTLRDNPIEYKHNYHERVQARAPMSLRFLDGEPITVEPYSFGLLMMLAFQQEDGDRF